MQDKPQGQIFYQEQFCITQVAALAWPHILTAARSSMNQTHIWYTTSSPERASYVEDLILV